MSKWKAGQLVTLNNRVYRIREVETRRQRRRCMMCELWNFIPPCIDGGDNPIDKINFGIIECVDKMPQNCIPKRI